MAERTHTSKEERDGDKDGYGKVSNKWKDQTSKEQLLDFIYSMKKEKIDFLMNEVDEEQRFQRITMDSILIPLWFYPWCDFYTEEKEDWYIDHIINLDRRHKEIPCTFFLDLEHLSETIEVVYWNWNSYNISLDKYAVAWYLLLRWFVSLYDFTFLKWLNE